MCCSRCGIFCAVDRFKLGASAPSRCTHRKNRRRGFECLQQRGHLWRRGLGRLQRRQQPAQRFGVRQHRAGETRAVCTSDQQRRKSLDIEIVGDVGVVFDVDPRKSEPRMSTRDLLEQRPVFATRAAPFGAQADNPRHSGSGRRLRRRARHGEHGRGVECVRRSGHEGGAWQFRV
jgi:hypothetical protein